MQTSAVTSSVSSDPLDTRLEDAISAVYASTSPNSELNHSTTSSSSSSSSFSNTQNQEQSHILRSTTVHKITPTEATKILNEQAFDISSSIPSVESSGIHKVQIATLPANEQNEDTYAYDFLPDAATKYGDGVGVQEKHWSFFAVYDGHYGPSTSKYLKSALVSAVYTSLLGLYKSHLPGHPPNPLVISTISTTFATLDSALTSTATPSSTQGSCALLTFHDTRHNRLFTACTGDSRSVLGKRLGSPSNTRWLSKPLSTDQNFTSNPSEVTRVESEHPGEKDVIIQGRLIGDLAVSRAFGNRRFKVPDEFGGKMTRNKRQYGVLRSPPYITAEPVVTVHEGLKDGDFVLLATDGLWDFLSSEDSVALVGRWTDEHIAPVGRNSSNARNKRKTRLTSSQEEMYVFEDDPNVGVHLIRNALGGVREGKLLFTLGLEPGINKAKKHRDDITVLAVFFGS
ncbi:hypothetical protein TWF569_009439 [Orbilia oligospora]|uniref:PPM-type phosphatase domain-containing protein n=1 Tax=Orbilia oligospora TaxID=2813651 RepID=A0A7C8JFL1_ORBOL|nr:hypothetical protein TWF103_011150 [Orbilia oligospora]KAF3109117.1 hypothetical protein TWF102_009894 [Orbilia oligospora]KAF3114022.1 hypothetical protein TWF706_009365 [Orbilia oligospora]KAF3122865.1 hypothetical protein TWF594_002602 [Orbilia oligospora]KAF3128865.1 hypothetical protein TWF703_009240 [Orbilia oligospora]